MEKILKPYTIIPPHLYVTRNADRQLKQIVSDMGRPGYVLVSRQMGKTNLLLNAKRELSNETDIFVYVDLSNTFDDEVSCFQNIIDIAIETNEDLFSDLKDKIEEIRNSSKNIPAHKQHEQELRTLLKKIKGKFVVILDEIDALTKTSYSDKIFAQIRSIYFSRINFPDFERLTYILSGVVEPSEIIKDPKISPFNIGEKIFLNDFSEDEFREFIKKAKLDNLNSDIIDRIFYWTNGNPRMTWDVCSKIEEEILNVKLIADVDSIIQDLYLTSFNKPPIDHIREIVASDKSIRNAIIEIDYNKGRAVADNIKSKLYLAGIINYEENDIKIKNKVIKESLSRNWIESVKLQEQGVLSLAIEEFQKGNYQKAIELYERFLSENEFPDKDSENSAYYYFGLAFYNIGDYTNAIEKLQKCNFSVKSYPSLFFRVKRIIGICLLVQEKIVESIEYFQQVVENSTKDFNYANSLLNLGSAYLKIEGDENLKKAEESYKKVIDENGYDITDSNSENEINEIKAIAYYNLGFLYQSFGIEPSGFEFDDYLKKSLNIANVNFKPHVFQKLIKFSDNIETEKLYLKEYINHIIDNKLNIYDDTYENQYKFTWIILYELVEIAFELNIDELERLLMYIKESSKIEVAVDELLLATSFYLNSLKKYDTSADILKYSHANRDRSIITETAYKTLKFLSYFVKYPTESKYSLEYLDVFIKNRTLPIDYYDFDIVAYTSLSIADKGDFDKAQNYIKYFYSLEKEIDEELRINFVPLRHIDLQIESVKGNSIGKMVLAKKLLEDIKATDFKKYNGNLLNSKAIEDIKNYAQEILNPTFGNLPVESNKAFNRNDKLRVRYHDGRIVEKKYKYLEQDILKNNCRII